MRYPRLAPLRPYLIGDEPGSDGEWALHCPLHPDEKRSASLNVKKEVFNCFRCGGLSLRQLLRRKDEWVGGPALDPSREADRLPHEDLISQWNVRLLTDERALERFTSLRGLNRDTIAEYNLGFDGRYYKIPVYNREGVLINVRTYNPGAKTGRKIWSVKGHAMAVLYPAAIVDNMPYEIIICEGELDALASIQNGFPAITRTGSAREWKDGWNRYFEGKAVYVCHDRDEAGERGNAIVASHLKEIAEKVLELVLPYPLTDKNGKDLTDFWNDHPGKRGKMKGLMRRALPLVNREPPKAVRENADITEVIRAANVGQMLRFTGSVRGKSDKKYFIPRRVKFECSPESICPHCPFDHKGGEIEIEANDPVSFKLMNARDDEVIKMLRRIAGVPAKCDVKPTIAEYHSIETVFVKPELSNLNGHSPNMNFVALTVIGHSNLPSNATAQMTGAPHPNPRTQETEFLASGFQEVRKVDWGMQLPRERVDALKRTFQPRKGQTPYAKLREIARDMSHHVTRIYERPNLHILMDMVWHSVLKFNFEGQLVTRGWMELLVIGDTRTGKSNIANRLKGHYQAGEIAVCEGASFAGLYGGAQQVKGDWNITWGVIPANDARLVVLDEVSHLSKDHIAQMSNARSSGIASVQKIAGDETLARVRMIWMGNPRAEHTDMSNFLYGARAIAELIGTREDIARFDMATTLRSDDVPLERTSKKPISGEPKHDSQDCSDLVQWAWTRKESQVIWDDGAERTVREVQSRFSDVYPDNPPLLISNDSWVKIARMSVSVAARLFSTDDGDQLIVKREHVLTAEKIIDIVYGAPNFGFKMMGDKTHHEEQRTRDSADVLVEILLGTRNLLNFLIDIPGGMFTTRELESAIGDYGATNEKISQLNGLSAIRSTGGNHIINPAFREIIMETHRKEMGG
jgi:hypothetical protein